MSPIFKLKIFIRKLCFFLLKSRYKNTVRLNTTSLPKETEVLFGISENFAINLEFLKRYKPNRISIPEIPKSLVRKSYALPCDYIGDAVFNVRNAQVKGNLPVGYTSSNAILTDTIHYSDHDGRFSQTMAINSLPRFNFINKTDKNNVVDYACIMMSNWNHYGHWILEHALKFQYLMAVQKKLNIKIKLIVEVNCPKWKLDIINRFGWGEEDLYIWKGNDLFVGNLIVPNYPFGTKYEYLQLSNSLRNVFNIPYIDATKTEKLYLSREKIGTRCVSNEEELTDYLRSQGFTILYPEKMSIAEQILSFSKAKIIVGPHGSAFTNLIYCQNCQVVEFFGGAVPMVFYKVAQIMELDYNALFCAAGENKDDSMLVNINKLHEILTK